MSDDLSSHRTELAFDRTAWASDRTLMAEVRTALALIGFGFTIFTFFHKLRADSIAGGLPAHAPARFSLGLIVLGIILLSIGIANHARQASRRRDYRQELIDQGLIHRPDMAGPNSSMIAAGLLLAVGLLALLRVGFSLGPL